LTWDAVLKKWLLMTLANLHGYGHLCQNKENCFNGVKDVFKGFQKYQSTLRDENVIQ